MRDSLFLHDTYVVYFDSMGIRSGFRESLLFTLILIFDFTLILDIQKKDQVAAKPNITS